MINLDKARDTWQKCYEAAVKTGDYNYDVMGDVVEELIAEISAVRAVTEDLRCQCDCDAKAVWLGREVDEVSVLSDECSDRWHDPDKRVRIA